MTSIDIGSLKDTKSGCPFNVKVELKGQSGSAWYSDAVAKISPTLKTDSDGYEFSMEFTGLGISLTSAPGTLLTSGGCVTTTGNNLVCLLMTTDGTQTNSLRGEWIKRSKTSMAAPFDAGTAITAAKWGVTYTGTLKNCIGGATVALVPECTPTILTGNDAARTAASFGIKYYQPKETADKVYAGLPRFSKGEELYYYGVFMG
jgi:hypothetical protein